MFHDPILPEDSQGARAEGRVLEMSFFDKLAYVRKYLWSHKKEASDPCKRFFEQQKQEWKQWVQEAPYSEAQIGVFGDLMWIRKNWDSYLTPNSLQRLRSFDGLFGNLETVISRRFPIRSYLPDRFRFNSPPEFLDLFRKENGESLFSALSFANNHSLDFGDQGVLDTTGHLLERKIPFAGILGKDFCTVTVKNFRLGFLAATFGVNDPRDLHHSQSRLSIVPQLAPEKPNQRPDFSRILRGLREMDEEKVDAKIVCLHWGFEFEYYPTSRMMEAAQLLADNGADLIFGCHPHIPHPPAILSARGKRVLLYTSLGNFASAMYTFPCRVAPVQRIGIRKLDQGTELFPIGTELFYQQSWRGGRKLVSAMEFPFSNSHPRLIELRKHLGI